MCHIACKLQVAIMPDPSSTAHAILKCNSYLPLAETCRIYIFTHKVSQWSILLQNSKEVVQRNAKIKIMCH